jgi:hypothetical protein
MAFAKRKAEPSAEEREQALLAEIHDMRVRLNQYLDARTLQLKQSRDGAGLPMEVLRRGLVQHDPCLCHCVARLLGDLNA